MNRGDVTILIAACITAFLRMRVQYWIDRADRAEAALARVETVIDDTNAEVGVAGAGK